MNSIDKQQPEKNEENLVGQEAARKIKELADEAKSCFLCTNIRSGQPFTTRPMAVQEIDEEGNIWFLSAEDSLKNKELGVDPFVQLLFQGSTHSDFLSVHGRAAITKDKDKIKQLWTPLAKTWFTEGINDPRITVIKVEPDGGHYWDTKHNMLVAFAKQIAGAITGQTLDDSIQGDINL